MANGTKHHELTFKFSTVAERDRFEEWLSREHKEMVHAQSCGALTPIGKGYKNAVSEAIATATYGSKQD